MFNTHVNLIDLADARGHPDHPLTKFATEKELSQYTLMTRRTVSASSAEASGLSRALLRYIFQPPDDNLRRDEFGQFIENQRFLAKPEPKKQSDELKGRAVESHGKKETCKARPASDKGNGDEAAKKRKARKKKRKATQTSTQPETGPVISFGAQYL